jgi:hypothetical protein
MSTVWCVFGCAFSYSSFYSTLKDMDVRYVFLLLITTKFSYLALIINCILALRLTPAFHIF